MSVKTKINQLQSLLYSGITKIRLIVTGKRFVFVTLVALSVIGGLQLILTLMPRLVTFAYAGESCVSQPLFLPGISTENNSNYDIYFKGGVKVLNKQLFTTSMCSKSVEAPKQMHSEHIALKAFGVLPYKWIKIKTLGYPAANIMIENDKISTTLPLSIFISEPDSTFDYFIESNNKSADCTTVNLLLSCDVASLGLKQGEELDISLKRAFESQVVESVFSQKVVTLEPLNVIGGNASNGSVIFDQPANLELVFDKKLSSINDLQLAIKSDGSLSDIGFTHQIQDEKVVITPDQPLKRQSIYSLQLAQATSIESHTLVNAYSSEFIVSGGPVVAGHNTGSYGYNPTKSIVLTFDQDLNPDQDLSGLVSISGVGVPSYRISIGQNTVIINPNTNLPSCSHVDISVSTGIQNVHGVASDSTWSHRFKTLCRRVSSIGTSVEGRSILANWYGHGPRMVVYIGGIHGNETSSVNTLNSWLDELERNYHQIPADKTIVVITIANPDGKQRSSRFNANGVDLNRNFPTSDWRTDASGPGYINQPGRGGATPLSEPEAVALSNFINTYRPRSVLTFHAAASIVSPNFAGDSVGLAQIYAQNSPYAYANTEEADAAFGYASTGDFEDWMAQVGITNVIIEHSYLTRNEFNTNVNALWAMAKS